jgi:hypothetical protein
MYDVIIHTLYMMQNGYVMLHEYTSLCTHTCTWTQTYMRCVWCLWRNMQTGWACRKMGQGIHVFVCPILFGNQWLGFYIYPWIIQYCSKQSIPMGHYGSWWVIFHIFHLLPMETIIIFHMFSIVNCNRFPSCPWEKCTDLGPGDARCIQTLENLGASDWDYFPILYWIIWMIRYYTNDIIKVMIKRFITGLYE